MIYELRTVTVLPQKVAAYEQKLAETLEARQRHSRLAACWHTEIGPLNQVIQLWPYQSAAERERVLAAVAGDPDSQLDAAALVVREQVESLKPTPFMRPLVEGAHGPIYEWRRYQYRAGVIPTVIEKWAAKLPEREAYSPLLACFYTDDSGPLGSWIHVWPYPDLNTRARARAEALASKAWPPATAEWLISMENAILLPAAFSPLK